MGCTPFSTRAISDSFEICSKIQEKRKNTIFKYLFSKYPLPLQASQVNPCKVRTSFFFRRKLCTLFLQHLLRVQDTVGDSSQ